MPRHLLHIAALSAAVTLGLAACETGNAPLEDGEIRAGSVDADAKAYETPGEDNDDLPTAADPKEMRPPAEEETERTDPYLGPYNETLFD